MKTAVGADEPERPDWVPLNTTPAHTTAGRLSEAEPVDERINRYLASDAPKKVSYVDAPRLFMLSQACSILTEAFGAVSYHVGSSLHRPDFRDVDVRMILTDDEYAAMFPGAERGIREMVNARWSVLCSSISLYLRQASGGLPIDYQFQQMTDANQRYPGPRHPLGIFPQPPSS